MLEIYFTTYYDVQNRIYNFMHVSTCYCKNKDRDDVHCIPQTLIITI